MNDNIKSIINKYDELTLRMESPKLYSDIEQYTKTVKELSELEPLYKLCKQIEDSENNLLAANDMIDDPEYSEFAKEEAHYYKSELLRLNNSLNELLKPKDPDDGKNVILEIRGGVGGEESSLFARDLFRMYSMYAEKQGWDVSITNSNFTELGGIKEIILVISGNNVYSKLKYEAGGHRVQRVPVTESSGRIHTSAATVAVLPEVEEVDFKLDLNDVRIDTYRSSGAGGQHVNKTESAIRLTHIPTGLVVECQDERSQYKNKDRAFSILRSKLYQAEREKQQSELASVRKNQVGSGDRNDRIRTYNFPQSRVTDHRLEGEGRSFPISQIIDGDLEPLISALAVALAEKE